MNKETIHNLLSSLSPILNNGIINDKNFKQSAINYLDKVDLDNNQRSDIPKEDLRGILQATKLMLCNSAPQPQYQTDEILPFIDDTVTVQFFEHTFILDKCVDDTICDIKEFNSLVVGPFDFSDPFALRSLQEKIEGQLLDVPTEDLQNNTDKYAAKLRLYHSLNLILQVASQKIWKG